MASTRVDRRLAAILAADVVGYSRLIEQDEAGTVERLKAHRKEFIEPLIAEHHGRIVKLMGDGALCEFGSVVDAVQCAVLIQQGMTEREADTPEDQRIRFRIGINLGDVILEDGDLYGDGVNIAARLEGLAEPGGILISGTAYDQVEGKLPLALAFAGEQRVKNIERSVRTYRIDLAGSPKARLTAAARSRRTPTLAIAAAVGLLVVALGAGGAWWHWGRGDEAPPAPEVAQPLEPLPAGKVSLAVLPLASPGGDARQERLADGIAEDLIGELGRYRNIAVIAKSSSFTYKGKAVDAREVGRELGVRYVLEGSLETDPERVRVAVQLIDTGTGAQVWSERWDRPLRDVFAIRDELVGQIAATLLSYGGVVMANTVERARRKPPQNLDAYDYVQLAEAAYRPEKEGLAEARALLEKAIALDPSYPRAYYRLAWVHFNDALNGYSDDPGRSLEQFHAAAEQTVALDPMDPYAQFIAGLSYFKRGERARGKEAWERALALAPNDPSILRSVGTNMAYGMGTENAAEAVDMIKRARRLNPLAPGWTIQALGFASYFAGQYEQAIAALETSGVATLELKVMKALTYAQLGRKTDAAREVEAILKERPDFTARGYIANDIMEPGGSSETLFLDGARKAGLPIDQPAPSN
jgi:class 3 adenylate cyclase/TolB-like protein/cytochrome c-type biogenesis protein CcmH/NrfG